MFLVPGPARCGGFHPGKNELEIKRIDHQSERVVATEAAYISDHDSERSRNIYTGRYNGPRPCTLLTSKRCPERHQARSLQHELFDADPEVPRSTIPRLMARLL